MTQKIINGFPQYQDYTWKRAKFHGTSFTQIDRQKTDINLQLDVIGDPIQVNENTISLLHVYRDGVWLHPDQGFELIGENTIRISPGLLMSESIEFMFFTGASGVLNYIPVAPPVPSEDGYNQTVFEAIAFTNNEHPTVNAFAPTLINGKTRLTFHFPITQGRIDVYLNGTRAGQHSGLWTIIDDTTIELNDDYSAETMKVELVKQIVGI